MNQISPFFAFQVHPDMTLLETINELNETFKGQEERFQEMHPEKKVSLIFDKNYQDFSPTDFVNKGPSLFMSGMLREKISPQLTPETFGYMAAIHYIETKILSHDLSTYTPNQILQLIKDIHAKLIRAKTSDFRTQMCIILDLTIVPVERTTKTFPQLDKRIREHGTEAQFEVWKRSARSKAWDYFKGTEKIEALTPQEYDVFKLFTVPCPSEKEVASLMETFAKEFCEKIKQEKDVFNLMAWVHEELAMKIHPFADGNGRIARLMMMLAQRHTQKDAPYLILDNLKNYTEATKSGSVDTFANYLRGLVAKQVKAQQFVIDCFRDLYETSLNHYKLKA